MKNSEIKEPFCSFCSFPYPSHHPDCPKSIENSKKSEKEIEKERALEEKPISDQEYREEKSKRVNNLLDATDKEIEEEKEAIEEPSQGHEITDEEIDDLIGDLFNKPSTRMEKIIPKPELEKKKGEEVEKTIDNIWGLLQDEINRLKLEKMDDRQKKYLKNYIKSILKGYLTKEFKNLENIEDIKLSVDWLISKKQKIFQTITSKLKEKILLKYGYPSNIMEIFQNAVKETSEYIDNF